MRSVLKPEDFENQPDNTLDKQAYVVMLIDYTNDGFFFRAGDGEGVLPYPTPPLYATYHQAVKERTKLSKEYWNHVFEMDDDDEFTAWMWTIETHYSILSLASQASEMTGLSESPVYWSRPCLTQPQKDWVANYLLNNIDLYEIVTIKLPLEV